MSKLIAFYGNSLLEKENSYSSFLAAANRNFYGIEKDKKYFDIAYKRIYTTIDKE